MSLLPFDLSQPQGAPPRTVSEVSRLIVQSLSEGLPNSLRVRGEISNFAERNGHRFFSLRDDSATLDAVMWASSARGSQHRPTDGDEVVVTGRVSHWTRGGRTRLEVQRLELDGEGRLRAAFLRRCAELRERGWFEETHKQALPSWPRRVAVVTSAQGAALTDVIATARGRFPATALLVVDVRVQGTAAATEVARAIHGLDAAATTASIDAIIVTRGGGSAEDLDAFNAEQVASAVFHARTPIVAAIGHESDTTIIELVADRRASTPTQAVIHLLPDRADVDARVDSLAQRVAQVMNRDLQRARQRTLQGGQRLDRLTALAVDRQRQRAAVLERRLSAVRPDRLLDRRRMQVRTLTERLSMAMVRNQRDRDQLPAFARRLRSAVKNQLQQGRSQLAGLERALNAVDPLAVLQRGYSITTDAQGRSIRDHADCGVGDIVETRLAAGRLRSRIEATSAQS